MSQPQFSEATSQVTDGIRVNVRSIFLTEESHPQQNHFVFAYQVQITNESSESVQLISRQWNITDGQGERRVVKGEGVVGKQPVIAPGATHEYVSGCDFKTPIGRMNGYYYMVRISDGSSLKVRIPAFIMVAPAVLN